MKLELQVQVSDSLENGAEEGETCAFNIPCKVAFNCHSFHILSLQYSQRHYTCLTGSSVEQYNHLFTALNF